jgi:hypothetical protein
MNVERLVIFETQLVDFIAMKSGFDKYVAKYDIISKKSMGIQRVNARCLFAAAQASFDS